jgi:hypothetical protein
VIEVRRRLRYDQTNKENTARSARAPLKNGAAINGSRLKIVINVADMIGSSEASVKTSRSFLLTRIKINGA